MSEQPKCEYLVVVVVVMTMTPMTAIIIKLNY
jgi:hypothetical protein